MSSWAQYKRADGSIPDPLPDGRAQFYNFVTGKILFQFPPGHPLCPPHFAAACAAADPDYVRMNPPSAQQESQQPASNQMQQSAQSQAQHSAAMAHSLVPVVDTEKLGNLSAKLTGKSPVGLFQRSESPELPRSLGPPSKPYSKPYTGYQSGMGYQSPSALQSPYSFGYSSGYGGPYSGRPQFNPPALPSSTGQLESVKTPAPVTKSAELDELRETFSTTTTVEQSPQSSQSPQASAKASAASSSTTMVPYNQTAALPQNARTGPRGSGDSMFSDNTYRKKPGQSSTAGRPGNRGRSNHYEKTVVHPDNPKYFGKEMVQDPKGIWYIINDNASFPWGGTAVEIKIWLEEHGCWAICAMCLALCRDCNHKFPCSSCEELELGDHCRMAYDPEEFCQRFGIRCRELHKLSYELLKALFPKMDMKYWTFPSNPKFLGKVGHAYTVNQETGQVVQGHAKQQGQLFEGHIALPWSQKNPNGYTTAPGPAPKWIWQTFLEPFWRATDKTRNIKYESWSRSLRTQPFLRGQKGEIVEVHNPPSDHLMRQIQEFTKSWRFDESLLGQHAPPAKGTAGSSGGRKNPRAPGSNAPASAVMRVKQVIPPSAKSQDEFSVVPTTNKSAKTYDLRPDFVPVDDEDFQFFKDYPREAWPEMLSDWKGIYAQCLAKQRAADAKRQAEMPPAVATPNLYDAMLTHNVESTASGEAKEEEEA